MPKIVVDKYREILPITILRDRIHAIEVVPNEGYSAEFIHISHELYEAILKDPDIVDRIRNSPTQMSLFK